MREWEQRYESYRQYRTQYLMVTSLAFTGFVLGIGVAMSERISPHGRFALLLAVCLVAASYLAAHIIVIPTIRALGNRIKVLEEEIGIGKLGTTRSLQKALLVTLIGAFMGLCLTVYLLFGFG